MAKSADARLKLTSLVRSACVNLPRRVFASSTDPRLRPQAMLGGGGVLSLCVAAVA